MHNKDRFNVSFLHSFVTLQFDVLIFFCFFYLSFFFCLFIEILKWTQAFHCTVMHFSVFFLFSFSNATRFCSNNTWVFKSSTNVPVQRLSSSLSSTTKTAIHNATHLHTHIHTNNWRTSQEHTLNLIFVLTWCTCSGSQFTLFLQFNLDAFWFMWII